MIVNNNKIKKDLLVKAYQLKNQGKSKSEVKNILKSNFILPTKIYDYQYKSFPDEDNLVVLGLPVSFENQYKYILFNFDAKELEWLRNLLKQTDEKNFADLVKSVTNEITSYRLTMEELTGMSKDHEPDEDELESYKYVYANPSYLFWLNISDLSIIDYGNNVYAIHLVFSTKTKSSHHDLIQFKTAYELKSKYPNIIFFAHYKEKPNQYISYADLGIDKSVKYALLYRKFYSDYGYKGEYEEVLETPNIDITVENSKGIDVYEPSEPYKPSSWWELFKRFFLMNRR